MPHEIEIKLRLHDPAPLREQLRHVGARRASACLESNTLLDTPSRELLSRDAGLRVREQRWEDGEASATLTYKGPRKNAGALKAREELEVEISDANATIDLLTRLGYQVSVRFEKRRERWRIDAAEIALDELPRLGWFVEIEADSETDIARIREQLGLLSAEVIEETYVALAATLGEPDPDGGIGLRFEPSRE